MTKNFYKEVNAFCDNLIKAGFGDHKIKDLNKSNWDMNDFGLGFLLQQHYHKELTSWEHSSPDEIWDFDEKWERILWNYNVLPDPTIKEIYNKNQKHREWTEKLIYKICYLPSIHLNNQAKTGPQYSYSFECFESVRKNYEQKYKPVDVISGEWKLLYIEWKHPTYDMEESALICHHSDINLSIMDELKGVTKGVNGFVYVSIIDADAYGKKEKLPQEWIDKAAKKNAFSWDDIILEICMSENSLNNFAFTYQNGVIIRACENRYREYTQYDINDRAAILAFPWFWTKTPYLFDPNLEKNNPLKKLAAEYVNDKKDACHKSFRIGINGDLNELKEFSANNIYFDWTHCARGAARSRQHINFIDYLFNNGANKQVVLNELIFSGIGGIEVKKGTNVPVPNRKKCDFDDQTEFIDNDEYINYALEHGFCNWNYGFEEAVRFENLKWMDFFLKKGAINQIDALLYACKNIKDKNKHDMMIKILIDNDVNIQCPKCEKNIKEHL